MKILYHHRTKGRGAEGVHMRGIVTALQELGNEVYIVSPPGVDPFVEHKADVTKRSTKKIWEFVSTRFPELLFELLELAYNLIAYISLKRLLNKVKDIDLIYERYSFFCWISSYIASYYRIPLIFEVNEMSETDRIRPLLLKKFAKRIEKKIFNRAMAIIVVSKFLKEEIRKLGVTSKKIYVIPNAVDIKKFNVTAHDNFKRGNFNLTDEIVIGFVGSFVPWHNLKLLLETLKEIIQEGNENIRLMLVGDGPQRSEIEDLVYTEGLSKYVIFTGYIEHDEVSAFIRLMDICVIPHSNRFRSPLKMFEYMAMAKPVVAPRLEPIEDIIVDGENGILFEPEDKTSLKEAIIYLIRNKKKREEIGNMARRTVIENYTWRANAIKILRIFEKQKAEVGG